MARYYEGLAVRFAKFPGFAQTETLSDKFGGRATAKTPLKMGGVAVTAGRPRFQRRAWRMLWARLRRWAGQGERAARWGG